MPGTAERTSSTVPVTALTGAAAWGTTSVASGTAGTGPDEGLGEACGADCADGAWVAGGAMLELAPGSWLVPVARGEPKRT